MSVVYKTPAGRRRLEKRYRGHLDSWPVPADQVWVPTREGETLVVASGAVDSPPLVLLHGSGGNSANWRGDIPAWATYFRVYAVDIIGEPGLSSQARPSLDSDAMSLWLADVLDELGLAASSIVGMSLGGWLATDFATRLPHRVNRLALLCPGGIGRQTMGWMLTSIPLMMLGRWGIRRSTARVTGLRGPQFEPILDDVVSTFEDFKPRRERLPIFPDASLRRLGMPVQVTVGAHDVMFDSADTVRRMKVHVPQAEIQILPDAGHALLARSMSVLEFLKGSDRTVQ